MSKNELIVTLFTIIYGLMLTDLFFSLHKLLRKKHVVKWHWLPLLTAWYLFLIILKNWWDLTAFTQDTQTINLLFFLAFGHLLFLIFLLVSAALPDKIPDDGIDLKKYYFENHRYFWGLMTVMLFLLILIKTAKRYYYTGVFNLAESIAMLIYFSFTLSLSRFKNYKLHAIVVVLIVLMLFAELASKLL